MKAVVELVYENRSFNRRIEVEVKDSLKGQRLLNAIDKAVNKEAAKDSQWTSWNLISC